MQTEQHQQNNAVKPYRNNSTTYSQQLSQIAGTNIPAAVANRWAQIEPHKFSEQKAVQCFAVVRGGWNQVLPEGVESALRCETPTIGAVAFYMDRQDAVQVISEMISAVSVLMNVGKNIRGEQIAMISEILFSEFRHLTIADFRAAMRMGALGKFGTSYDRLDVQVISEWCTKFFDLRCDMAEGKNAIQHKEEKRTGKEIRMPDWFLEFSKKVEKRAESQQPKKFVPDQLILQQWKIDFDQLPEQNRPKWESYVSFQVAKLSK